MNFYPVQNPISNDNVIASRDLHEQLLQKQDLISALDAKILEATKGDDEIKAEVLEAKETISTAKARIYNQSSETVRGDNYFQRCNITPTHH